MIECEGLVFEYPGKRALQDVTFQVARGTVTALVGPNGAGKTTLLRCLAALSSPFSGTARINEMDVVRQPREVHRQTSLVPDDFGVFQSLTTERCLVHAARMRGLSDSEAQERAALVADQLDLTPLLDARAGALSRGQRQRLAVAQAIVHEPAVLLLDEPASGLDPVARERLAELMRSLGRSGMTIIVSSHILAELEAYCTGMLVLREGQVVGHEALRPDSQTASSRRLRIRLLREVREIATALESAGLREIAIDGRQVLARFDGDEAGLAELLQALIERGVPILEFAQEEERLADVYRSAVSAGEGGGAE